MAWHRRHSFNHAQYLALNHGDAGNGQVNLVLASYFSNLTLKRSFSLTDYLGEVFEIEIEGNFQGGEVHHSVLCPVFGFRYPAQGEVQSLFVH